MGQNSKISWTTHTFNPWRGCTKVSTGCANCYAEAMSGRNPKVLGIWGPQGTRVVASESMWREPVKWDRAAKEAGERHRVFCASLADVFEGPETMPADGRMVVFAARKRLGKLIVDTPNLDWLLLTKRPQNVIIFSRDMWPHLHDSHPFPNNVWLGISVEDQQRSDERIPLLLDIPAPVRFVSCEPLLGPIDLERIAIADGSGFWNALNGIKTLHVVENDGRKSWAMTHDPIGTGIDWTVVGGESGPGRRPCDVMWIKSIVDSCRESGVAAFVKQDQGMFPGRQGEIPDQLWNIKEFPKIKQGA